VFLDAVFYPLRNKIDTSFFIHVDRYKKVIFLEFPISSTHKMSVVTVSSFDAKKLSVSDVKKLDNGSSQVYINYDGKRLRLQAPRMTVPYDAGDYKENKKYKVSFSFKGMDVNPKVAAYFKVLEAIDNFVIDQATKNAAKWFKMPGASRDVVSTIYTPSVKYAIDSATGDRKDLPPTQSVALKTPKGAFDTEMYDNKNQSIEGLTPVEVLRRNAEVTPIVDATGIWIADKKFGLSWKLHQVRIDVNGEGGATRGFLGVEEDSSSVPAVVGGAGAGVTEDDEEDLMAAVLPGKTHAAPAAADDEEDDDEEDDGEIVPAPPVPVKKTVAATPAPATAAATTTKKVVKKVVKA
jgi:hypothetical protein